ncbi:MAG: arsenate reductase ArsC [Proteobacteria bacterium]|nr:arsenate reductase ArsC [Pseudomonadota bacterium]
MSDKESAGHPYNVLFLCTGNSVRSIMAEAILNRVGAPRFRAYSAGSRPKGEVSPQTIALLRSFRFKTDGLCSKSWEEFAAPGAPKLDFVFTVCDNAANEVCPVWPGQPMSAHWGVPDPAAAGGSQAIISRALFDAYRLLQNRIGMFCALPLTSLDRLSLKRMIRDIGKMRRDPSEEGAA